MSILNSLMGKGGHKNDCDGGSDTSLLFFFLLLIIIFSNSCMDIDDDSLLFFFLLLVVLFCGFGDCNDYDYGKDRCHGSSDPCPC